ncbi:MAG: D-glycero-beta-D-manno-heptose-7-phosphate kinase [Thalassobius sp.]|nr:D-glycero-beta-D-manno-heptose-7-phosphate kinase [Thalassovita sp.]
MVNPEKLRADFSNLNALIIGDVMIDSYVWGKVSRISPEAPVPIVNVDRREIRLGGAGNVALNIKALGANPILCAVTGNDDESRNVSYLLAKRKLSTDGIFSINDRLTTVKHRILAGSQHMMRIDTETEEEIADIEKERILDYIKGILDQVDVIIFEDYDKGVLSESLIQSVVTLAKSHSIPTIVDPKKRNFLSYKGVSLFKPNLKELKEGLKVEFDKNDLKALDQSLNKLNEVMPTESSMVTLSENGVYISDFKDKHHINAHKREIADVSGAGDTVVSIAALCMAAGLPLDKIAAISNLGGGLVCEHLGVVPINLDTLLNEITRLKI